MRRLIACLVLALAAASHAQTAGFQGLGILGTPPSGLAASVASAVSPDGQVVVGLSSTGARAQEAFR